MGCGKTALALRTIKMLLFVPGFNSLELGFNPDLQKVRPAVRQIIKLTVPDAGTSAHASHRCCLRYDTAAVT